jgi:hypothetical protein
LPRAPRQRDRQHTQTASLSTCCSPTAIFAPRSRVGG